MCYFSVLVVSLGYIWWHWFSHGEIWSCYCSWKYGTRETSCWVCVFTVSQTNKVGIWKGLLIWFGYGDATSYMCMSMFINCTELVDYTRLVCITFWHLVLSLAVKIKSMLLLNSDVSTSIHMPSSGNEEKVRAIGELIRWRNDTITHARSFLRGDRVLWPHQHTSEHRIRSEPH